MVNRLRFAKAKSVRTGETLQQVKISGPSAGWHWGGRVVCCVLHPVCRCSHLMCFPLITLAPCCSSNLFSMLPPQDFALAAPSSWHALPLLIPPQRSLPHLCQSLLKRPLLRGVTWPSTEISPSLSACFVIAFSLAFIIPPTYIFSPSH